MPRWLERLIAFCALIALSPFLLIVMVAIVLDSPGWPLFLQRRVGRGGQLFWLIKFRKMAASVPVDGKGITTNHDIRLTRMGRLMERFKIDELPQFVNVILGDMSLVGPRPEIPRFTEFYPEKWKKVLSVRPGVVGYSQVRVPHENDLYPPDCFDHEKYYVERILPGKLDDEINYVSRKNTWLDFSILFRVTIALLTKTFTLRWIGVHLLHLFILAGDTLISCFSLCVGFFLIHPQFIIGDMQSNLRVSLFAALCVRPVVFAIFGLHRQPIFSFISLNTFIRIIKASLYSSLALVVAMLLFFERDLIIRAHVIDVFLLPSFLIWSRVAVVMILDTIREKNTFHSWIHACQHLAIMFLFGALGYLSFLVSFILRLQGFYPELLLGHQTVSACIFLIRAGLSYFTWPPKARSWQSFFYREFVANFHLAAIGTGLIFLTYQFLEIRYFSRSVLLIDLALYTVLSTAVSMIWFLPKSRRGKIQEPRRVLLFGAGVATEFFINTLHRQRNDTLEVVGIITDVEWNRFSSIAGVKVIGTISDLESLFEVHHPDLLIAWEEMKDRKRSSFIQELCRKHNVELLISPGIQDLLNQRESREQTPTSGREAAAVLQ